MEKVPEEYNYYNLNGVIYTKIDIGYGSYVEFIGSNDIFNMWVVERVTGNPRNVNFMRLEN